GGGLRANRQPVDDRQVADDLAGEAVGEVVVGGVLVQVDQRQNRYRNGRVLAPQPPPAHRRQGDYQAGKRGAEPKPDTEPPGTLRAGSGRFARSLRAVNDWNIAALWQLDD